MSARLLKQGNLLAAPVVASVGAIGSGANDIKMLDKAEISFATHNNDEARSCADAIMLGNSLDDVIMAVTVSRSFKAHLLKFILLQLPASVTAIAMVLTQVFLYDAILVNVVFIFLVNLVYFPIAVGALIRERPNKSITE